MFGSIFLEVAIGLVFIYLLISLICSTVNEWISKLTSARAVTLEKWMLNLLGDPEKLTKFYEHPLIKNLFEKSGKKPSYISSGIFSTVLLDTYQLLSPPNPASNLKQLIQEAALPPQNIKDLLISLISDAADTIDKFKNNIEKYYDEAMNRVSGWYKRQMSFIILIISIVVCVFLNIDTIRLVRQLSIDSNMRTTLSGYAVQYMNSENTNATDDIQAVRDELEKMPMPIGWQDLSGEMASANLTLNPVLFWFEKILGLIISSFAVSLGAPFWFDILNQAIKLSGKKPQQS